MVISFSILLQTDTLRQTWVNLYFLSLTQTGWGKGRGESEDSTSDGLWAGTGGWVCVWVRKSELLSLFNGHRESVGEGEKRRKEIERGLKQHRKNSHHTNPKELTVKERAHRECGGLACMHYWSSVNAKHCEYERKDSMHYFFLSCTNLSPRIRFIP